MKIVIIVNRLTGGGAERVASLWAKGFAQRGHDVTVITHTKDKHQLTYKLPAKVKLWSIDIPIRNRIIRGILNRSGLFKAFSYWRLDKILHVIKPDVCIGVLDDYAYRAYQCTRDIGCKIINTEHNAYDRPDLKEKYPKDIKMKYETNKLFDAVTVLTKADTMVTGAPKENMFVLPNPLTYNPVCNIPKKDNIILAAGRLDVWYIKGFDLLIEAWGQIACEYPDWKLQIAGTGGHKARTHLEHIIDKCRVRNQVEFVGFCHNMQELYKRASIFVLSSRHEGFGMVLTEAMSQGCACVACDFGGRQREIIEDKTQGLVCDNNSIDAIKNALIRFLSDKEYLKLCATNAIKRSAYYSLDNTMDRWETILSNIMEK